MQQIGRYEILGELGRGGMGVVYLGRDPAIGRQVAIKTIRLHDVSDAQEKQWLEQRLLREARSAGILSHPYIVTVHDVGQEGSLAYIVMEYVKGATLERRLQEGQAPGREFVLNTLRQTSMALDYAHGNGIVHRDIKPSNILIHQDGIAKITDFGVAKIMTTQQMTRSGSILGTPNYMAPEQLAGSHVDGRADQFSLAGIGYLMLTGETAYTADTLPALVYKIVHEDPPPPQDLNPTLGVPVEAVLRRAMARTPDARFATCSDFAAALEAALESCPGWQALPRRKPPETQTATRAPVLDDSGAQVETAGTAPVVCQACSARLPWGARFCLICGAAVTTLPTPAPAPRTPTPRTPTPRTPAAPRTPSTPRKRLLTSPQLEAELPPPAPRRRWLVWTAAAVLVAGAGAWFGWWRARQAMSQRPPQETARLAPPPPPPKVAEPTVTPPPAPPQTVERRAEPVAPPPKILKPYRPEPVVTPKTTAAPPPAPEPPKVQEQPRVTGPPPRVEPSPPAPSPAPAAGPPAAAPPPAEPPKPTSGEVVWTGVLEPNAVLIINGRSTVPAGALSEALPSIPVALLITPAAVRVQAMPLPGSVVLHNTGPRQTTIRIRWTAR